MFPPKPLKRILRQNCPYHIREEAIWELKKFLEDIAQKVGMESVKEFEELNRRREKLGLSKLKRLNAWAVKRGEEKVFSNINNNKMGFQSKPPEIGSPGGKKMQGKEDATKPKPTTDDHVEVV